MIEKSAKVISKESNHKIKVLIENTKNCISCNNKCANKLFANPKQFLTINNRNLENYSIGDKVTICINSNNLLKLSLLFYIIPIISLLVFTIIFRELYNNELFMLVGCISGLLFGIIIVKRYISYYNFNEEIIIKKNCLNN